MCQVVANLLTQGGLSLGAENSSGAFDHALPDRQRNPHSDGIGTYRHCINHQIHILGALGIELGDRLHPALAQQNTDAIGDCAFDSADDRHFEAGGPPRADGDQGLGCADGEVRGERNDGGGDDGGDSLHEEEGDDRNDGADGR